MENESKISQKWLNEPKISQKWLREMDAFTVLINDYRKYFHNRKGVKASEVLTKFSELHAGYYGDWLIEHLSFNEIRLVRDNVDGHLAYNGDVHVKGDFKTENVIYIKGSLKIDGKLTIKGKGGLNTGITHVIAHKIDISGNAKILTDTNTKILNMRDHAILSGEINSKIIYMSDTSHINGNTEAKIIQFNDGGNILGKILANVINSNRGCMNGKVDAAIVNLNNNTRVFNNVNADIVKLNNSNIYGNVDANEIINDGGYISGDVNTIKIKNINGGSVRGKTIFKSSNNMKFPENVNAVIVCGGRDFTNRDFVFSILDEHHKKTTIGLIIQGGAAGTDAMAAEWANSRAIPYKEFKADWKRYGKSAGPKRNKEMLEYLMKRTAKKYVIAFPGGAGTLNMVIQATSANIAVWAPYGPNTFGNNSWSRIKNSHLVYTCRDPNVYCNYELIEA